MEVKMKKCKSGNTYKFVNEYWETSRAWGHKTTIIRNMYDYEPHKVRYYNRTWESYTYQTCMSGARAEILHNEVEKFISNYKFEHNIDKFKKGERLKVIKMFKETELGKDLEELRLAISNNEFDYYA